jgi:hypothetical protein
VRRVRGKVEAINVLRESIMRTLLLGGGKSMLLGTGGGMKRERKCGRVGVVMCLKCFRRS